MQLRKRQLEQEVQRSRVLQDALHVLARENHNLERVVQKSPPVRNVQLTPSNVSTNGLESDSRYSLNGSILNMPYGDFEQSDESELDDLFYECENQDQADEGNDNSG